MSANELVFVQRKSELPSVVRRIIEKESAGLGYAAKNFAVTDTNVARLHPDILPKENVFAIEAGEERKTLASVEDICRGMLDAGMDRSATVVAYGGGVVGDVAGFAASVYMRGVNFVNVPTTLLAQVDSAIGGKTGVNLGGYKNMIGAFKMPSHIVICPELLLTLDGREWNCGMGELVKTAFLDKELYDYTVKNIDALVNRDGAATEYAVTAAARFKKSVTDEDPTEKGRRAILNLGHTVGHALEKCDEHRLSHGEYVSLGMKIEFAMTELRAENAAFASSADKLLSRAGLPALPRISEDDVCKAAKSDKKNAGGTISVIGLYGAGEWYTKKFTAREFREKYASCVHKLTESGELRYE